MINNSNMKEGFFIVPPGSDESPAVTVARIESLSEKRLSASGSGHMVWHIWGNGRPPLVLLHGGFGSWLHWIRTIPFLANRFTVFVPTLPGFGESDDAADPEIESLASTVSAGIDCVLPQQKRFHMLGFSFGGMVGGLVAALQGKRIVSHTFSGSGGMGLARNSQEPLHNWRKAKTTEERMAAHRRNLEILMFADPGKVDDLAVYIQDWNTQRARVRTYKYRKLDILRDPLRQAKGRLMGLYGSRDAITRGHLQDRARYLSAIQPDSIVREVPGAGHWACYEAAEDFSRIYIEMLESIQR